MDKLLRAHPCQKQLVHNYQELLLHQLACMHQSTIWEFLFFDLLQRSNQGI